jgi:nucleoside diphosphate kinase
LDIPEYLTAPPRKRELYAVDTYFREGLEDVMSLGEPFSRWFSHNFALLLIKPDAVVTRRLRPIVDWVRQRGFQIAAATAVTFDRHRIRALWQYGLNAASRDRRDAADLYMTASESLVLILHSPDRPEPASRLLSGLKGPADPARCRPGQLRYDLGSRNYQLNLVHAADDPADLVRELAVLYDYPARIAHLRALATRRDIAGQPYDVIERLESGNPEVSLDLPEVLTDLERAAPRIGAGDADGSVRQLHRLIGQVRSGESRDWRRLLYLGDLVGPPVPVWHRIVIATHLLDPYVPGVASLLPDSGAG